MTKPTIGTLDDTVTTISDGMVCGSINQFALMSLASDELTVRWCAIGDPTDWPTPNTDDARAKQAGQQTFNGKYGIITGIAGNDFFGYIFQQKAITKATYVGGDVVFSFDTFEEGRGCFEYNRFVQIDDLVIFESEFGRHSLDNGVVNDIGYGVTDDSFTPEPSAEQKTVAVNTGIHTVFFEDGNLAYNYRTNQWTQVSGLTASHFYSIDSADGLIGQIVFSGDSVDLQTSTGGAALNATLETFERDLNQGGRATVSGVRPLIKESTTTSVQVRVGARDDLTEGATYTTLVQNTRSGLYNGRVDSRYQRIWMQVSGFETILGADVEYVPSGNV